MSEVARRTGLQIHSDTARTTVLRSESTGTSPLGEKFAGVLQVAQADLLRANAALGTGDLERARLAVGAASGQFSGMLDWLRDAAGTVDPRALRKLPPLPDLTELDAASAEQLGAAAGRALGEVEVALLSLSSGLDARGLVVAALEGARVWMERGANASSPAASQVCFNAAAVGVGSIRGLIATELLDHAGMLKSIAYVADYAEAYAGRSLRVDPKLNRDELGNVLGLLRQMREAVQHSRADAFDPPRGAMPATHDVLAAFDELQVLAVARERTLWPSLGRVQTSELCRGSKSQRAEALHGELRSIESMDIRATRLFGYLQDMRNQGIPHPEVVLIELDRRRTRSRWLVATPEGFRIKRRRLASWARTSDWRFHDIKGPKDLMGADPQQLRWVLELCVEEVKRANQKGEAPFPKGWKEKSVLLEVPALRDATANGTLSYAAAANFCTDLLCRRWVPRTEWSPALREWSNAGPVIQRDGWPDNKATPYVHLKRAIQALAEHGISQEPGALDLLRETFTVLQNHRGNGHGWGRHRLQGIAELALTEAAAASPRELTDLVRSLLVLMTEEYECSPLHGSAAKKRDTVLTAAYYALQEARKEMEAWSFTSDLRAELKNAREGSVSLACYYVERMGDAAHARPDAVKAHIGEIYDVLVQEELEQGESRESADRLAMEALKVASGGRNWALVLRALRAEERTPRRLPLRLPDFPL